MALTKWSDYVANFPQKAQQLTQILMCAKGAGTNENYVFEVDPITGGLPIIVSAKAVGLANTPARNVYTITPVTTLAYVQLVAATALDSYSFQIFDSSGETIVFALGAPGAEVDKFYIFPGGISGEFYIPSGSRVSVKAVSNTANVGELDLNLFT